MLNWIKFITTFLLALTVVIAIIVLYNANKPFTQAEQAAIESVMGTGQLKDVQRADTYQGSAAWVTVRGVDGEGVEKAVFVGPQAEEAYKEVKLAEGISADTAIETVKKELDVKKVLHTALGMEEIGPVWEVAFTSADGKLNYVYVQFENGQWWKRILNL
ncbi:hypothetical protein AB1K83_14090 [Sporosarcina sp. 179-K 3D1 HS]|uniref:hypothetical protein n=1 Tax=Sporosarcina sp. 179-K 3D1 HS TaxID=3232169 RepID=UPI0039A0517D